jgi:hypothetical protein
MNQRATARVIPREPELQIIPLERARPAWDAIAGSHPDTTLYHRGPWLEVLRRSFGVQPSLAMLTDASSTLAACLLAPGGNPIRRRLISLPYSDFCPPLAVDDSSRDSLMSGLASLVPRSRLEIRGAAAPAPWQVRDHFQRWTLDLLRPFNAIERDADREVRRHMRRARAAAVSIDCSSSADAIDSFFRLQLESRRRLGVPSQPRQFFKVVQEVFAKLSSIEVWFASHHGVRVAGVVVLRDGDTLHAKWSARTAGAPDGASHLIFMSIAEVYALRARALDFGRTDSRNRGLTRFKRELGAIAHPIPYSYLPMAPNLDSAESLTGLWRIASRMWRTLPIPVARIVGNMTYRYLA